jgi:hypothetical protein
MAEPAGRADVPLMLGLPARNAVPFMLELPLPPLGGIAGLPNALVGERFIGAALGAAIPLFVASAPIMNTAANRGQSFIRRVTP